MGVLDKGFTTSKAEVALCMLYQLEIMLRHIKSVKYMVFFEGPVITLSDNPPVIFSR